jgi:hypothetical protein
MFITGQSVIDNAFIYLNFVTCVNLLP